MSSSILGRFRNEREVGIPRRLSIRAAFVLLTIYCVLARGLVLLGADATWTGLICAFFGVVTFAQMMLFRGVRPREASIVAGSIAAPGLYGLILLDSLSTRWLGWNAAEFGGFRNFTQIGSVFFLLFIAGLFLGYLVGIALAGVFYVLQKIRRPSATEAAASTPPPFVDETLDTPFFVKAAAAYSFLGGIINPFPKGSPLRGPVAMFEIHLLLALAVAPFIVFAMPGQVLIYLVIQGLVLAFLMGALQLRWYWPLILAVIGYSLDSWVFAELAEVPMFHNIMQEVTGRGRPSGYHAVVFVCKASCVGAGLVIAAVIGWSQWLTRSRRGLPRFGVPVLVVASLLLVGLAWLARNRIQAFAHTPKQDVIRRVAANKGLFWLNSHFEFGSIDLRDGLTDADAQLTIPDLAYGAELGLYSEQFTDKTILALDGKSFSLLGLGNLDISDDVFARLKNGISAQYLYFESCPVSTAMLKGLLKDPLMQSMLEIVSFDGTELNDLDLSPLAVCKSLERLYIANVDLSEYDFTSLRRLKTLDNVVLSNCSLTDDCISQLCRGLPASVTQLGLNANKLSDASLLELSKLLQLQQLDVQNMEGITAEGVAAFEGAIPQCVVRWTETESD